MSENDYNIEDTHENLIDGLVVSQMSKIHRMLRIDPDRDMSNEDGWKMVAVLRWYQAMRRRSIGVPDLDNLCFHAGELPHVASIAHAMRMIDEWDGNGTQKKKNEVIELKVESEPEENIITRFHRLEII